MGAVQKFQSTPPCRGELLERPSYEARVCFNPHPRAGVNKLCPCHRAVRVKFQSTPPCGGERAQVAFLTVVGTVSIHTPVRG